MWFGVVRLRASRAIAAPSRRDAWNPNNAELSVDAHYWCVLNITATLAYPAPSLGPDPGTRPASGHGL
jgi:hypothetical protein